MELLIVAEKPELGMAIAGALFEKYERHSGYVMSEDGRCVTWCYGHMLRLKEPEHISSDYKKWTLESLPIYRSPWPLLPYARAADQIGVIRQLLRQTGHVIHAGDPDDEGQLIVDELLEYAGYAGAVSRVLINDNNPEEIRKAFAKAQDNKKYMPMGNSARARREADGIFGFNLSRYYTRVNNSFMPVGRVQIPTLGLIVARDAQIEGFAKREHYEVVAVPEGSSLELAWRPAADSPFLVDGKILDAAFADERRSALTGKEVRIAVSTDSVKRLPPLPYNLTVLQAEAAKRFGYKPQLTLDITQQLREEFRAITYNRSDSQYLNDEHHAHAPAALGRACANLGMDLPEALDFGIKGRCFDDSKVTAHHGIIPTKTKLAADALTQEQCNIYTLIVVRYMCQFMPAAHYERKTAYAGLDGGESLFARSSRLLSCGYLAVSSEGAWTADEGEGGTPQDEGPEGNECLFAIPDGEHEAVVGHTCVRRKETSPPKRYTYDTLISDMASIAKYVKDPETRRLLKEKDDGKAGENGGIGTSATRADIIEKLTGPKAGYVMVKGRQLISTEKGRVLYNVLREDIRGPEVTARWWVIQESIRRGEMDVEALSLSVLKTVKDIISDAGADTKIFWPKDKETFGRCPICGGRVQKNSSAFSCEFTRVKDCTFFVMKAHPFFVARGKRKISDGVMKSLLQHGEAKVAGFKKKDGAGTYDATVVMHAPPGTGGGVRFELRFDKPDPRKA
jgi:DNA topoisomerase-3